MNKLPLEPKFQDGASFMFALKAWARDVAKALNPISDWATQAANYFNFSNGQFLLQDGTVTTPGLAWNSEPGLGWYRSGANQVDMAAAGASTFGFYANNALVTGLVGYPRSAGGTSQVQLWNQPKGTANFNYLSLQQKADGSSAISTSAAGTATRGNLTLDAPAVLMPNQPAFYANGANGVGANSVIVFGSVVFNRGSNYNAGNGRFTAPASGVYFFRFNAMQQPTNAGDTRYHLLLNGGIITGTSHIMSYAASQFSSCEVGAHIYMNAGDYVQAYVTNNSNTIFSADPNWSSFSGHLVG
jgi:hypothetical protein